jgi:hypothetical protein
MPSSKYDDDDDNDDNDNDDDDDDDDDDDNDVAPGVVIAAHGRRIALPAAGTILPQRIVVAIERMARRGGNWANENRRGGIGRVENEEEPRRSQRQYS